MVYFSYLKMPETTAFGSDFCFFGASDEVSELANWLTAAAACELAVDIHEM
jgi:hypothetical protein